MKLSADTLERDGHRLLDKMSHSQLMSFLMPYLNKLNAATVSFFAASMTFLSAIALFAAISISTEKSGTCIIYIIGGCFSAYALIPIHEYLHAMAYKANGAKHVSYDVNLGKFIFLTVADKFVANRREFFKIALTPFAVITTTLLLILPFLGLHWQLFVLGVLFIHTLFCIGDFGLVSYFLSHKEKTVVTYDDKLKKETYFYVLDQSPRIDETDKKLR